MAVKQLPIIWTATAIGAFLRVGPDAVYALVRETDAPIHKAGGRLYCFEDEIEEWMRRPENQASTQNPKAA